MEDIVEVSFHWTGEEREMVMLAGEFNSWQPEPMEREEGGKTISKWSQTL